MNFPLLERKPPVFAPVPLKYNRFPFFGPILPNRPRAKIDAITPPTVVMIYQPRIYVFFFKQQQKSIIITVVPPNLNQVEKTDFYESSVSESLLWSRDGSIAIDCQSLLTLTHLSNPTLRALRFR